ncbi:MAG: EAL domain-containing protein, partial [Xanthomonadales bacterium]|nr:EAL domain-containing protein [Xanthomonadales bacterium]
DEFLVILPRTDSAGAESSAAILIETLALPQSLQGMQIMLDATVGIAAFPEHGDDPATLLARADIALNDAKSQNRRWSVYRPGRDQNQRDKLSLANDLRSALSRKELVLYYQPKLDLQRNQVIHAEALVRWIHPTRGFVPPDAFIALAEQTGRIRELTRWVLMTAIAQVRGWHQMGHRVGVAVNLSAHDLMDDGLPDYVQDLLHKFSVNPRELVLEVTESAVMRDAVYGMEMLHRLRALGIGLAIDDYGTGYSSLSYLKQLPVDEIKIDKSFVMNLDRDIDDAVIVRSTIDLGHNMGLQVVAEGVEDASSLERLRGFGCDLAQGYFISRPLPEAQMIEWLNQRRENEVPAGA